MHLDCSGVSLSDNAKKVSAYGFIKSGVTLIQSKGSLENIPGLIVSYETDILGMGGEGEACAKMPCGHVISTESMTAFLRSIID
jgi:hypothetical protein